MNVSANSAPAAKNSTAAVKGYEPVKKQSVSQTTEGTKSENTKPDPEYKLEISDAAQEKKDSESSSEAKVGNGFKDFDMDAFQGTIRSQLMESIINAKKSLMEAGVEFAKYNENSILYDLSALKDGDNIKAADVPEYWNAENTSQRIVDFAMSFRSLAPELSDEEYIDKMRKAVELGYKLAKRDVGDLPGPSAKLFNDTYNLTMKKFDELLEQAQKNATGA
ncbi:MAG: hypothetical protein LBU89_04965 [Fibromonadaceae bacterium]|jgi:hypothetical protein|nr:hypothetical protein [Fibromonadaceae bacterium]